MNPTKERPCHLLKSRSIQTPPRGTPQAENNRTRNSTLSQPTNHKSRTTQRPTPSRGCVATANIHGDLGRNRTRYTPTTTGTQPTSRITSNLHERKPNITSPNSSLADIPPLSRDTNFPQRFVPTVTTANLTITITETTLPFTNSSLASPYYLVGTKTALPLADQSLISRLNITSTYTTLPPTDFCLLGDYTVTGTKMTLPITNVPLGARGTIITATSTLLFSITLNLPIRRRTIGSKSTETKRTHDPPLKRRVSRTRPPPGTRRQRERISQKH